MQNTYCSTIGKPLDRRTYARQWSKKNVPTVQAAKLQPKVKCIVYKTVVADKTTSLRQGKNEGDMLCELSRTNRKAEKHKPKAENKHVEDEAGRSQDTKRNASECRRRRRQSRVKWLSF